MSAIVSTAAQSTPSDRPRQVLVSGHVCFEQISTSLLWCQFSFNFEKWHYQRIHCDFGLFSTVHQAWWRIPGLINTKSVSSKTWNATYGSTLHWAQFQFAGIMGHGWLAVATGARWTFWQKFIVVFINTIINHKIILSKPSTRLLIYTNVLVSVNLRA